MVTLTGLDKCLIVIMTVACLAAIGTWHLYIDTGTIIALLSQIHDPCLQLEI